jgi:hypothetical protein
MRTRRLALAAVISCALTGAVPSLVGAVTSTVRVRDFSRHSYVRPQALRFSEDGDLIGAGLTWTGWGSARAVGIGTFVFTVLPSHREVNLHGTVTLTARRSCHGRRYYTRAFVHARGEPFKPQIAGLDPC